MENTVMTRLSGGGQSNLSSLTGIDAGNNPFRVAEQRTIKPGFTLAEVLITLGIIGVVAAMTLPALINKTQHQELVTSFKKVYSELSQVYMKIKADNGGTFDGLCKSSDDYYILFSKYMKKVKVCNASTVLGKCWPKDWYYSTGTKVSAEEVDSSSLILPSGTSMLFYYMSEACDSTIELKEPIGCGRIRVDLNGLKKPNVVGKDIFDFYITKDALIPRGSDKTTDSITSDWGRAAYVLQNGKIDY